MGHDITLFKKVRYIRRNIAGRDIKYLYKALDCEEYNGGASGIGGYTYLTDDDLPHLKNGLDMLKRLQKNGLVGEDIVEFVQEVIKSLQEVGEVVIDFS